MGKKGFFGGFYPFPSKSDLLFVRLSNRLQERVGGANAVRWTKYGWNTLDFELNIFFRMFYPDLS